MGKRLQIIWWSRTGASEQLARAAAEGALEAGEGAVEVRLTRCDQAGGAELLAADHLLGFDWEAIALWTRDRPQFSVFLSHVYSSLLWQPAILMPLLAYADPERLRRVPKAWDKAFEVNASESEAVRASCVEFVLAGLYATDRISRAQKHGRITYEVK